MNKEQLIEELRVSIVSKRLLEVVSIGAVEVGGDLIILKQRPSYEFNREEAITYSEQQPMGYPYKELIAKTVIFDHKLFNRRGHKAMFDYMIEEEFKYCQESSCGKLLDRENNEYHRRFGTCDQYCYARMVGVSI
jgi:hypothetical protein